MSSHLLLSLHKVGEKMADNNTNGTDVNFNGGDILGSLSGDVSGIRRDTGAIRTDVRILEDIDRKLSAILGNSSKWSQTSARSRTQDVFNDRSEFGRSSSREYKQSKESGSSKYNNKRADLDIDYRGFADGIKEALYDSIGASGFKDSLNSIFQQFADELNVNINDVEKELGKKFAKDFLDNNPFVESLKQSAKGMFNNALDAMQGSVRRRVENSTDPNLSDADRMRQLSSVDKVFDLFRTLANPTARSQETAADEPSSRTEENTVDGTVRNNFPSLNSDVHSILEILQAKFGEALETSSGPDIGDVVDNVLDVQDMVDLPEVAGEAGELGELAGELGELAGEAATALEGLALAAPEVAVALIAMEVATDLIEARLQQFQDCFKPLTQAFEDFSKSLDKTANRMYKSADEKLKSESERLAADVDSMVKEPFNILTEAAQEWYDTWDNNLQTINATQGYTKESLYELMSSYAERLREEGLSSYVSSADITENLASVLKAGLSGEVATEFAYLATVLNQAIPTQDFFSYADTYSTIAANAMSLGASQSEAIAEANEQLEEFANSILYASRQVSGGFTSGLTNASEIMSDAVKIATTARVGDSSEISAVLTAITSSVSAVAPDLASSLVDTVVSAATGGNSSELVALRSLAGTGASNTAFLTALAEDPQTVISNLFSTLGTYQSMSSSNFMEVAENLASVFGMTIDTFTRIDFNSLADVVKNVTVGVDSLNENLELLKSGETTTTAEQLKMQEVNQMILDEGLSYVLDNEVARAVQEHMWNQELAEQLMEAEYGVELIGSTKKMFLGIAETVQKIIDFLNPLTLLNDITELVGTATEEAAMQSDIMQVLKLGQIGEGNSSVLRNYTTYDVDSLTSSIDNLVDLMGGTSAYSLVSNYTNLRRSLSKSVLAGYDNTLSGTSGISVLDALSGTSGISVLDALSGITSSSSSGVTSQYTWTSGSKSLANLIGNTLGSSGFEETPLTSGQATINTNSTNRFNEFLKSMEAAATGRDSEGNLTDEQLSYQTWANTASQYGITDLASAAESMGLSESDLQSQYLSYQAKETSQEEAERNEAESQFWTSVTDFVNTYFKTEYTAWLHNEFDVQTQVLNTISTTLTGFKDSWTKDWLNDRWDKWNSSWTNTFVGTILTGSDGIQPSAKTIKDLLDDQYNTHAKYSKETDDAAKEAKEAKDKQGTSTTNAVLALADKLSSLSDLTDPQVQTNALLSQILIVVQAIMQAENQSGSASLSTTLSGIALGLKGTSVTASTKNKTKN